MNIDNNQNDQENYDNNEMLLSSDNNQEEYNIMNQNEDNIGNNANISNEISNKKEKININYNQNNIQAENENENDQKIDGNDEGDGNGNENDNLDYNDVNEDMYMQQLYKQLAKMRQERKDAQNNAKSLDNRLNLLKEEELKTLKKIEATKKMANNKLLRLQERVENNRIKEEAKKFKEKEIEQKRDRNKKMNEEIKNNTVKNKAMRQKQIEDEAKLVKMQKQYNKQLFNYLKEEHMNENKTRYKCIKNHKNFNEEKKKIENREKRLKLKQDLEKKLLEEYRLKEEAEAKKLKAEQEELEIIKKLQTTTQLHKNITEEMEKMNINSVMKGDYGFLGDNINNNNLNQK